MTKINIIHLRINNGMEMVDCKLHLRSWLSKKLSYLCRNAIC